MPGVTARPLSLGHETLRLQDELRFLSANISGLLNILGGSHADIVSLPSGDYINEAKNGVAELMPKVQALAHRKDELRAKLALLPRYEATLRKLLPIIPPSAHEPGNVSIGVLVSREHITVLDSVCKRVLELTGGRAEVVASDVDTLTRAMLMVFPAEFTAEIETILGHEDLTRLSLPEELSKSSPDMALEALKRQLVSLPEEIKKIEKELSHLAALWREKLIAWNQALQEEIEIYNVFSQFGETDYTFVLTGWVPEKDFEKVRTALMEVTNGVVLIQRLPMTPELKKRAPIILQNPHLARPFESLVNIFALPRYGHIDPTRLMAFFLPVFFGMILGDIGYGLLLLMISLGLMRRFKSGVVRDVLTVLAMGSGWAILFGILFGELFGTLGESIGIHPLWMNRASPEQITGLLLMTVAIGSIHITLGLILGVWEAIRDRSRGHLLERGGMLIALVSLFLLVGVLAHYLPDELRTPAVSGLILGIVLLGASLGWLGFIMGPIEFISLIGNVLSYLRIAAIGLASVYLAKVANDLAGMVGNLIVGAIVAILIHALNLVLGAFSPTIQSLRLHYVEFFRKFYEGGGRAYKPFKSRFGSGVST